MLSGSLDAFSLPDVFALLAMTKKTGVLSIAGGRTDGRVDFREGEIAYAVSDTRRMALASRLLGGGLVDEEQLRHVVAAQRGGAAALSRVLHDEGLLSPELFDTFVREQIQDAVFELMRLTEGNFSFTAEEADEPVRVRLPSDQLVAEGARRLEEWAQIKSHVISFSALVTLAPRPASESVTVSMEPAQWQLLTFVDGRRTVRDLVDLTGRGEYATCQVIAGLAEQGLVEVVDPAVGGRTGVSELVARHELLRRLEERELGAARPATPRLARANVLAPPPEPPAATPLPAASPRPVAAPEPEAVAVAAEPAAPEPAAVVVEPAPVAERLEPPAQLADRPEHHGRRRSEAPLRRDDATPPEGLAALERGPRPAPLAMAEDDDRHEDPPSSVFDAPAEPDGVVVDVAEVVHVAEVTELRPEPHPGADEDAEDAAEDPVVAYREDTASGRTKEEEDAFDRAEVERELAALGFRTANRVPHDDDAPPGPPFRAVRPDDNGRGGLLSRLMDGRKQP